MALIEEELNSKFESVQQKAMINIMFTANWIRNLHAGILKPHGLSVEQYNILRILNGSNQERLTMNHVRDRMIDRSPNTTRLMDRLLEKGAIDRERCTADRRVVYVRINQAGKKLVEKVNKDLSWLFDSVKASMTVQEAMNLNQLIEQFRKNTVELEPNN
jgi:DNA-binding MarR family transcriptional regulator